VNFAFLWLNSDSSSGTQTRDQRKYRTRVPHMSTEN
jgi:hypothetical protein